MVNYGDKKFHDIGTWLTEGSAEDLARAFGGLEVASKLKQV